MRRRVVLVGATGTFGSRLAAMLAEFPEIELVLVARREGALETLRRSLEQQGAAAHIVARPFDRSQPEKLAELSPWLVVDAAGPFQDSDYRLALAAVRLGAHYVDLADGRDYVAGFGSALNDAARKAGVLAVTAASSTPALSHAALEMLVEGWRQVDDVVVAISPGARAPRGLSVVEAILSYVGQPVRVFDSGDWRTVPGWSGLRTVHMPGLGKRFVSICETPDLDLLPERFPIRRNALFKAGLEVPVMHLGLALLGLPVRWGLLSSLRPLAKPLRALSGILALLGTDRGGMSVEALGHDAEDRPTHARWALWAETGAGPHTPAAPAAAMVRALIDGRETRRGAMACAGMLELRDILHELAHLPILTRADDGLPESPVLFERLLGRRWSGLPASVRAVHGGGHLSVSGRAIARIGANLPARLLRLLLGLPYSGRHKASVTLEPALDGERWTRRFGSSQFASLLTDTRRKRLGLFEERFGPLRFTFDLRPTPAGVSWELCGWSVAGLPLPGWLAPRIRAGAEGAGGLYRFRVLVAHRWIGPLFAYRGTLVPAASGISDDATSSSPSVKLPL
ncbi:DUF4166 domain-containing protein [Mesorhizobium zhangyense]|uniref:DUF4166 domain-containing protein n=1 Tax=Mesorhizobium zhangyense TaxID=1776730 RepID=UPI00197B7E43|nr:DUF4166 domain-containing protein [Mesorhizobium zhangyense]